MSFISWRVLYVPGHSDTAYVDELVDAPIEACLKHVLSAFEINAPEFIKGVKLIAKS